MNDGVFFPAYSTPTGIPLLFCRTRPSIPTSSRKSVALFFRLRPYILRRSPRNTTRFSDLRGCRLRVLLKGDRLSILIPPIGRALPKTARLPQILFEQQYSPTSGSRTRTASSLP